MAEKRIAKRLTAFVLGFCLVCTTCFHSAGVKANDSGETLTKLTLSELGISEGSYNSGATGVRTQGFGNTIVSFYATSSGPYTPRIHFGSWGEIDRTGINVLFYGAALVVGNDGFDGDADKKLDYTRTEITSDNFDLTSFLGQRILYQLQTEYLALDADEVKNDIRFILYVNKTEAVKVDIKDQADKLGNYIYFCDGVHALEDYVEQSTGKEEEVAKKDLTELKLSEVGIDGGSYDSGATGVCESGLANTAITFYATATGAYTPRIHFGTWGETDRSGINILFYGEALVVGNDGFDSEADRKLSYTRTEILASDFDLTSFLGEKILYRLETEYLALDTDEVENDIRFTLYVNEVEAVQIKLKNQTDKLGNYIYFCDGVFVLGDYKKPVQEKPGEVEKQELTKLKLSDIGIEEGIYDSGATGIRTESFANTSVRFYATGKGANTPRIHFGSWDETDRSGINILLFGETLVVGNDGFDSVPDRKLEYDRMEVVASQFGLSSFLEEKILYQLDTEYLALDTDEVVNDIRFTLYVNEKEAVEVKIKDQTEKLGNYIYFCDGVFILENEAEPEILEEDVKVELCTSYQKMTMRDYLLEEVDVVNGIIQKTYDDQSLHGTSFGATLLFSKDNNGTTAFYIGGDEWCGIRVEALADGNLGISHVGTDGKQVWLATITPEDAGIKTFLGEAFELLLTFDVYGESEGRGNCKIGCYINGELYQGEYLTLKKVEKETLTRRIFLYGSGKGTLSIQSVYKDVDYSIWGLTDKWKQTLGIVK